MGTQQRRQRLQFRVGLGIVRVVFQRSGRGESGGSDVDGAVGLEFRRNQWFTLIVFVIASVDVLEQLELRSSDTA